MDQNHYFNKATSYFCMFEDLFWRFASETNNICTGFIAEHTLHLIILEVLLNGNKFCFKIWARFSTKSHIPYANSNDTCVSG